MDIKATGEVLEVTLQSLYFSRTVVDTPLAPGVSMDRLRSPVEAAEASGDVAGDSVEVTVVDLSVVGVPAPL